MKGAVVYFMMAEDGGPIRMGCTSKPTAERMSSLQSMCPQRLVTLATMPGYRQREILMHFKFAADRLHGEWFRPTARLWEFIGEAQRTGDIAAVPKGPFEIFTLEDFEDRIAEHGLTLGDVCDFLAVRKSPIWRRPNYQLPTHVMAIIWALDTGWMRPTDFQSRSHESVPFHLLMKQGAA